MCKVTSCIVFVNLAQMRRNVLGRVCCVGHASYVCTLVFLGLVSGLVRLSHLLFRRWGLVSRVSRLLCHPFFQ
jgi:hypothetical protein